VLALLFAPRRAGTLQKSPPPSAKIDLYVKLYLSYLFSVVMVFVIVVFRRLQQLVRSALRLFLGSVGGRLLGDALPAPAAVMLLFSVVLVRFLSRVQFALPCVPGFLFVGAIVLHIVWLGGCHTNVFFVRFAFAPAKNVPFFTRVL
jgi:hypothetical protein